MSEPLELRTVKTNIYRTIVEDGLLDIMMGISLILSSIYLFNKFTFLNYLWLPIALVLIEVVRRRYIFPRTGYAKISLSKIEIFRVLGAILLGMTILATLIALIPSSMGHSVEGDWRGILSYALIFTLVISFCYIAYRFSFPRWYMLGISMGIAFLLSKAYFVPTLVLGLGIWIILVGVIVFRRFIKENPLKSSDVKESSNA